MRETNKTRSEIAGCLTFASLFQDPLLEEPPTSNAPAEDRRRYRSIAAEAENICQACPLMSQCLFDAVARHDVAGFVAGTTKKQRMEIRDLLGINVEPEDFDTLAGVTARHRQVDHDEVLRLRRANPDESLETLAHRLGCSLSTVKRHLRKAREGSDPKVTRLRKTRTVTPDLVLSALAEITRSQRAA